MKQCRVMNKQKRFNCIKTFTNNKTVEAKAKIFTQLKIIIGVYVFIDIKC